MDKMTEQTVVVTVRMSRPVPGKQIAARVQDLLAIAMTRGGLDLLAARCIEVKVEQR
jgi:hypothetical protein